MEFVNSKRDCFLLFILLIFGFNIFSQENNQPLQPGYFVDYSEDHPKIIQRFVWEEEEYALRYEVIIQVLEGIYNEFFNESTDKSFIEVSLPPGRYRYNVTPFDLLGRRGDASDWIQFEVIAAYLPIIERFHPERFFLDRETARVLDITGINFQSDSVFFLSNSFRQIYPIDSNILNEQRARLIFDDDKLIPGWYNIHIKNPGELQTNISGFGIGYRKPLDFFVRLAYQPPLIVSGGLKDIFGNSMFVSGYYFGFETIASRRSTFNGGLEFAGSVFFINPIVSFENNSVKLVYGKTSDDNTAALYDFDFNISLQKRFNSFQNSLTFRFGFGASILNGLKEYNASQVGAHLNINVSSLFQLYRILYLDVGIGFTSYFMGDNFALVKPRIGLTWRL